MDDPAIRPPHPLCTAVPLYSSAALTYADAQTRMDDPTLTDELTISLRTLNRIGKVSGGGGGRPGEGRGGGRAKSSPLACGHSTGSAR